MPDSNGPETGGCRADGLSGPARQVHRSVLAAFARTGQRPARSELERLARRPDVSLDAVLAELAETDAMAFDAGGEIRAAYPFSPIRTPIRVSWASGPAAYAMCAIDALRPHHHHPRRRGPGTLATADGGCVRRLGGRCMPPVSRLRLRVHQLLHHRAGRAGMGAPPPRDHRQAAHRARRL
jgi:hypothetical protein